jgi:hypothetical protein
MPVTLKLEEKPTDLGNEVKQGKILPVLHHHSTLTYGGVEALHGLLEAGKKKKISFGPSGNSTPIAQFLARSLDTE